MSSVSALNSLLSSGSSSASSLNLSQILEAAFGASSEGIDVNSAVNAAVTAAEAPENQWESQISTLQSQASVLNQLQSYAANLDNDMQAFNNLTGPLSQINVTSSNSSVVTGTAASNVATGNYQVQVNNLATLGSWTSAPLANASADMPAGSFTITTSTGTATITTDGSETLTDVANQINGESNLGISANVITDDTGSRLALISNTTGTAGNFTVTASQGNTYGFTQAAGTDASVTLDGILVSSSSNTITGIIPGLTLNLLSVDPGAYVSLGVGANTAQAASAINQFVSDYNVLLNAVNSQFTDTGSGQGVLATDPALRNLQSELEGAASFTSTLKGTNTSLASIGITMNKDGSLSVNSATLNNALQNNFSAVQNFFQGTSLNGFANSLDQALTGFISPGDGAFTVDLQSIGTQESSLQTDITNFQQNYITPLQNHLQSEYGQAEILLQELPAQTAQINAELGFNSKSQ